MEQNKLTPQQSLEVLEKATASLQLSRNEHILIINALQTLGGELASEKSMKDQLKEARDAALNFKGETK